MNARIIPPGILLLLMTGCAHVSADRGAWGKGATPSPGWAVVKRAAVEAAGDPWTWAPALGAAALQIGHVDQAIAKDARRENPLFGSAQAAADTSDWLRLGALGLYTGLGLAAPGPDDPAAWRRSKTGGFLSGAAALGTTAGVTRGLKSLTERTRPNREDDQSLPSGHASTTAAAVRLAADTLSYYELNRGTRIAAHTGLFTLAAATAWARVEAGKHHPSDVLLGAALGNFFARFTTEAFLRPVSGEHAVFTTEVLRGGGVFSLYLTY